MGLGPEKLSQMRSFPILVEPSTTTERYKAGTSTKMWILEPDCETTRSTADPELRSNGKRCLIIPEVTQAHDGSLARPSSRACSSPAISRPAPRLRRSSRDQEGPAGQEGPAPISGQPGSSRCLGDRKPVMRTISDHHEFELRDGAAGTMVLVRVDPPLSRRSGYPSSAVTP